LFKIHPDFDVLLGEILRRDREGRLILLEGQHPQWRERLIKRFERVIPDVVGRIMFLPPLKFDDFLALNAAVDVLLDPIHFGGGNTSYEAFSVAAPVVTLPSPYLKGRITQALYRLMGLSCCVADTAAGYVEIATRLGTDPAWRADVRKTILASSDRIFEDDSALRELESFFLRVEPVTRQRAS
jgi:predicted O-linked N-acetylglucosamine transferase (SPINDLY family)